MQKLNNKAKLTATITIALLMISAFALMVVPLKAQDDLPHGDLGALPGGSIPLPSGTTPDISYDTIAHLSFRPNPIGVGQPLLVNVWMQPPIHVARYHKEAYVVTFTSPSGNEIEVGPFSSYYGDSTGWFEQTFNEFGTWQVKFDFLGAFYPAGNYTSQAVWTLDQVLVADKSVYYKPSSDGPYDFVVQEELALSWPDLGLPTDYWTRPASPEHREWWPILGSYPSDGTVGGGPNWPPETNRYMSNYNFYPYVQAPNTAHIVWKRQGADSGLIGGNLGIWSFTRGGGGPNIVYAGRAYETITKMVDGEPTRVWQCYDLRTGEVYWEKYPATQVPNMVSYVSGTVKVIPGEEARFLDTAVELLYVGGRQFVSYDPWTGDEKYSFSIDPLSSGTFIANPNNFLSVQNLGGGEYRLINWTVTGDPTWPSITNHRMGVISNISFPFSSWNVADYEAMIGVRTESILPPTIGGRMGGVLYDSTGVAYAQRIMGVSLKTGQVLWNITTEDQGSTGGFFSGSTRVADQGKFAVRLNDGHWHCWDLYTGQKLWVSELSSWPWGTFGAYGVQSYGGMIISNQYDGVATYDWDDGKLVWLYKYEAPYPYEVVYKGSYPWFTGTARIADGKLYTYNTEHSESQPLARGYKLHCINITTGEGIWNITGRMSPGAVADGYLTASNSYDGYMYVFGKGKSETTITAPDVSVPLGTSFTIKGTVLDMSPAQPGTPAVDANSMAVQMEYLHMQHPIDGVGHDAVITGVPVSLTALGPDGSATNVQVTTEGYYGTFGTEWTPPEEGTYKIIASFLGDDSYGSSGAATYVTVGPAPEISTDGPGEEPAAHPLISTEAAIVIGVVVIAAVAIIAYVVMRRPKQ